MSSRDSRHDQLGRFFTSDIFEFEDPGLIRRTLGVMLAAVLAGSAAISIYAFVIEWTVTFRTAFAATLTFLLVTLLLRRGYPRLAGILMLLCLLTATAYGIALGDGIHDVAIVVFPAVIIIGSLLLNTRFFVVLTVMVIGCVAAIGVAEIRGEITTKFSGLFGYPDLFVIEVILAAEAVVIRLLASLIATSLMRAHRSELSYREIFNATSEAIFVHDADTGAALDVNDTSVALFGHSRDEMIGMMPEDLTPKHFKLTQTEWSGMLQQTMQDGTHAFEWLMVRKGGAPFWAEVTLRRAVIGGHTRILAVLRDVDARKKMEERLQQSEKLEAVGQLAGGVAHDFNNQLAGIVGYADLIRAEVEDGTEMADSANRILIAARRAADLTNQLLAFARKGKYESAAVDMHGLVEEVVSLLRHSVDKRIRLEQHLASGPSYTLGDPSQLQSAILNLAINARDAMPEGGVLTITTKILELAEGDERCERDELPPGRYIGVEVADTGTGMDEQTKRRIFEPFFTTKPKGKGTGMGLAAVYGTVKNHGGTIGVSSEPGKGSAFDIVLPLYEGPVLREERSAPPAPMFTARVLIVDDEEEVCRVETRILEGLGHTISVRRDGAAAVDSYRDTWRQVDLIVLDLSMPGITATETLAALREINPDAAVLLTSGFGINEEVQELIESGAYGFVQKPFSATEFKTAVTDALSRARGRELSSTEET
jgi:two-component system cell cycle sensor histidine kinase/response regulator CckA